MLHRPLKAAESYNAIYSMTRSIIQNRCDEKKENRINFINALTN